MNHRIVQSFTPLSINKLTTDFKKRLQLFCNSKYQYLGNKTEALILIIFAILKFFGLLYVTGSAKTLHVRVFIHLHKKTVNLQ